MTAPLEEQILDVIVAKLAAMSVAGGYQTAMSSDRVHRPAVGEREYSADELEDGAHISVRRAEKVSRYHLRGADEFILKVEIRATAATYAALVILLADILECVETNNRWHDGAANLAVRSWVEENDTPDFDESATEHFGQVLVCVKAYADLTNPAAVKAI